MELDRKTVSPAESMVKGIIKGNTTGAAFLKF
ncbi:hypothetical protein SAMN05216249_11330 [Acetitomaculum ruminis DSM 5522]|uniref:Uncharacterized protein n=1 Tax=Acetitomaculum ruminis DSM 5522 TaxID=1120918 RepID=A0A1I0Z5D7_9FIRM|nr:hypothetical protein SAMN05216249_11330 [Acetitomaculum ruminis DSM 5522]